MRKFIYGLMVSALFMVTGCTDFDDYSGESYGAGPDVAISVSAVGDSVFTVILTPAGTSSYYSYFIEGGELKDYSVSSVLKCTNTTGKAGTVKYADHNTFTFTFKGLPNTMYQIYAVAASSEGMTGKMANSNAITTDGVNPSPITVKGSSKGSEVTFSESIKRGSGKIVAHVYAPAAKMFVGEPIELTDENVVIAGPVVTLALPKAYAGSVVYFTWEANAFSDMKGNGSKAYTENSADLTKWKANYQVPTKEWKISAADTTIYFQDWMAVEMAVKVAIGDVYPGKKVDIKLVYRTEGKTSTIDLPNNNSDVNPTDSTFLMYLPEEPSFGAAIDIIINAGSLTDAYGNPNAEFSIEDYYYRSYGYEIDQFVGMYTLNEYSSYDKVWYEETGIEFVKDGKVKNGLIIKNMFEAGTKIKAIFDGHTGKIFIEDEQKLTDFIFKDGSSAELYFVNGGSMGDDVVFTINPNNMQMRSTDHWGYYIDGAGYYDAFSQSEFVSEASITQAMMPTSTRGAMVLHTAPRKLK